MRVKFKPQEKAGKSAIANPKSRNCSLGISLGKPYFSKTNLEALINFSLDMFNNTQVLIADSPERWNYMAIKGFSEEEALKRALAHGQLEANKVRRVVNRLKHTRDDTSRVKIQTFQEAIEDNPGFYDILSTLKEVYESNPDVQKTFRNWAILGVGKRIAETGLAGRDFETALRTATNYTIEEAALMICQADQNPNQFIDIYPASWNSSIYEFLRGLNEGKFPEVKEKLGMEKPYVHIQTRVQEPFAKRIGDYFGNKKGKNPEERRKLRGHFRERIEDLVKKTRSGAQVALASCLSLGGPTAFIISDSVTTEKREVRTLNEEEYTLTFRTNGRIEVTSKSNPSETWYDFNGDGKTIEGAAFYYGRIAGTLDSSEYLDDVNQTYKKLMAQS